MNEWPVWRIVMLKKATLQEIESFWCFEDIMKMNAILDMNDELEKTISKVKK